MATNTKGLKAETPMNNAFDKFPNFLAGKLCWTPEDFKDGKDKYIVELTTDEVHAVQEAIVSFKALGKTLPYLSPETFPLPQALVDRLRQISTQLHDGIGFAVLRGLNPKCYTDEENVIAYCGIASYVGGERITNAFGMSMNHLRNAEGDPKPTSRDTMKLNASKLSGGLKFHADRYYAEILAMFVKENAAFGGEQYLASFATIYNRMMEEDPNSLKLLAQEWSWPKDSIRDLDGPVIYESAGRVLVQLVWQAFIENPELASPEHWRALETVQRIAEQVSIELDHQAGDIQYVNNLAILHARNSFTDSPEKARHMLRMGLRDTNRGWLLPERYRKLTESAFKPVEEQNIPVLDFDPYFKTTVATTTAHHG